MTPEERINAAYDELHAIADELLVRGTGRRQAERDSFGRRLNAVAASLRTVLLEVEWED